MTTLRYILQEFPHAYIIIDALDECTEREVLLDVIQTMTDWKIASLHLLVTSRKEREIENCLGCQVWRWVDLQATVVTGDIEIHVRQCLQNDAKLKKWPAEVQAEIEGALTRGAHGM
jgi:hypothetical protein